MVLDYEKEDVEFSHVSVTRLFALNYATLAMSRLLREGRDPAAGNV